MRDLLTRSLPDAVRERLAADTPTLVAAGLAARNAGDVVESRGYKIEARANADGTYHVSGYATT